MTLRGSAGLAILLGAVVGLASVAKAADSALMVFAASSLEGPLREIAAAFEIDHAGWTVELNLAGSQILRTQIEQGARADVLASADPNHVLALQREGLMVDPEVFAGNAMTVVVPRRDSRIGSLADLSEHGVKIVLADAAVPAGRYAEQLLDAITAAGICGGEFKKRVMSNVVSRETSVRAVLAKVVLGEADAGFVYETDARASGEGVRTIAIPDSLGVLTEYWIALHAASRRPDVGHAFLAFVLGPNGRAILQRHGFRLPPPR